MPFRKYAAGNVGGIPPAPLIRENFSLIDYDFMKIKRQLSKEFPLFSFEELKEEMRKDVSPQELIISRIVAMGYHKSANEIIKLMKADSIEKHEDDVSDDSSRLCNDLKKLKMLAAVFSECEEWAKQGGWKDIILARIHLAELFHKAGDSWLTEKIIKSCLEYCTHLKSEIETDRNLIADIHMTMAFLLTEKEDADGDLQLDAIDHLNECRILTEDIQERKGHYYPDLGNKEDLPHYDLVQIKIDRPIAAHGWKNHKAVPGMEIIKSSEQSTFHICNILWSKILIKIANDAFELVESGYLTPAEDDTENSRNTSETIDRLFTQAFQLALQGHNSTNILIALYHHGTFLLNNGSLEKAREIFMDMHFKSLLFSDFETLGLAFHGLGRICNILKNIEDALGHYCNEWEIGCEKSFPALVIDSTRGMGKILLEEGQLVDAERCCRESYDKHRRLKEINDENEKNVNEDDPLFDLSWAMAGIAAGHALWGRFASLAKASNKNYNLLEWKSYRRPLPKVYNGSYRPKTIAQSKRHCDIKRIGRRLEIIEQAKEDEAHIVPMTPDELLREWENLLEEDDYVFEHDKDIESYRDKVIARSISMNNSLSVAMGQYNAFKKNLERRVVHDARSIHIKALVSAKLRQRQRKLRQAALKHHHQEENHFHGSGHTESSHHSMHNIHHHHHHNHRPVHEAVHHDVSHHFSEFHD